VAFGVATNTRITLHYGRSSKLVVEQSTRVGFAAEKKINESLIIICEIVALFEDQKNARAHQKPPNLKEFKQEFCKSTTTDP